MVIRKFAQKHFVDLQNECEYQSKMFWRYYTLLSRYDSLITIPCIVLSAITSLISSAQGVTDFTTCGKDKDSLLAFVTTIFAVTTTIMASLGKYFDYSQRALKSKQTAKSLAEMARQIRLKKILSMNIEMSDTEVIHEIEDIYRNLDILGREIEDLPTTVKEMLTNIQKQVTVVDQIEGHNLMKEPIFEESQI